MHLFSMQGFIRYDHLYILGAHTLGKNHGSGATWVTDGARFDNQYYIDLIDPVLKWRKGAIPG